MQKPDTTLPKDPCLENYRLDLSEIFKTNEKHNLQQEERLKRIVQYAKMREEKSGHYK